jgi:hypothetical protein
MQDNKLTTGRHRHKIFFQESYLKFSHVPLGHSPIYQLEGTDSEETDLGTVGKSSDEKTMFSLKCQDPVM